MGHETVELFIMASHMQYIFPFDVIFMMMAVFDMDQESRKERTKIEIILLSNTSFLSNPAHRLHEEGLGKVIF